MADPNKDTIYVDIDDEITALIDKVRTSNAKVVALVLPKRATVLQSIVNMKLLKRTADSEKKNLILITTESGLMPLAGAVGLHVAQNLTSKPEIPAGPNMGGGETDTVTEDVDLPMEEEETPDLTKKAGKGATVGALADSVPKEINAPKPSASDSVETLELDNEEDEAEEPTSDAKAAAPAAAAAAAASKAKKNKKLKVPNFNRFRLLLLAGVLVVIALIVLAILAFAVWPHATIDVKTDASNVNTSVQLTLDPEAQSADLSTGDIPAKEVSEQKTFTQTVNTTGQKNEGTAATGTVTMTAQDCSFTYSGPFTIPAGTGISYNNLTYITQNDTQMIIPGNGINKNSGCVNYESTGPTDIAAQSPGTSYNAQISNAAVSGYSEVTASGSASGGTDNIVQTVSQTDINTASSKINANDSGTVKQDLDSQLRGQGMYPVDVTFASGNPQISTSPNVGDTSNTVTVTETVTYTMYGAAQSDLNNALVANIRSQTSKSQNIISTGLNENGFKQESNSGTTNQVSLATNAVVGPNISTSQIKKEAAGKSPQAIISQIKSNPDVTSVTVRLSPFWVSSAPSSQSKITVKVAKPSKSV